MHVPEQSRTPAAHDVCDLEPFRGGGLSKSGYPRRWPRTLHVLPPDLELEVTCQLVSVVHPGLVGCFFAVTLNAEWLKFLLAVAATQPLDVIELQSPFGVADSAAVPVLF